MNRQTPATRERLSSQLDEVQRLSKIVDGLSLLTKADAGLVTLKQEPLRLDELVRDSLADAQILAQPRDVRVELGRCEAIPLPGDRHRLRQLLLNLTDNAIKYNQPGGTVTIDLRRSEWDAELKIANTGAGIRGGVAAAGVRPVFSRRRFPQQRGGRLRPGIEHRAMDCRRRTDGTIRITSQPEKLTTATVRLPVAAD